MRVSVVIPVFNRAELLRDRVLPSVIGQDSVHEILVVDDGSDRPVRVYSDQVQVIRQENAGAPAARNVGAQRATGDALLFLDSDDALRPGAVRAFSDAMDETGADIVFSDFVRGGVPFKAGPFTLKRLLYKNSLAVTSLVRMARFPGFDPDLPRGQDWDLWLRMCKAGATAYHIERPLFDVFVQPDSITNQVSWKRYLSAFKKKHPDCTR